MRTISYADGILEGFEFLLENHKEVFVIGQGLWSPWYVGSSMKDLDKKFGKDRVIDSPVSELGVTGAAVGAAICGYKPIVVHPRMDFMILAMDQIINQAAKWRHMFGGQSQAPVTVRGIINRGGEQGAQHSQALHSWYSHVPGLRVVMPATPKDARDLLIASVLSDDPVMYLDDRWSYDQTQEVGEVELLDLKNEGAKVLTPGSDVTLVGLGYSTNLCQEAAVKLEQQGISTEVIDIRIANPNDFAPVIASVKKTGNLCVVDGGWKNCGFAGEVIASVMEQLEPQLLKNKPIRMALTDAPAPTSKVLEDIYYTTSDMICEKINAQLGVLS